jgi:hypothetical protein
MERGALRAHIEEGFLKAERGEITGANQAQGEIQAMKENWLQERASGR